MNAAAPASLPSAPGPTRVLHVIDSFDLGGGQTALLNLLRATDRTRFTPAVAALHGRGVFRPAFQAAGLPVHSLSPDKRLPLYLPRLWLLLRRFRPEIIHCHLFASNWIAKPLAALAGVPVRINHDQCNDLLRYQRPLLRWWDTWTNRLSSHICAVSASTRDFLLQHEGLPPERVSLVYNGVDLSTYQPSPPAPAAALAPPLVLGVGRLHPQKDFSLFLRVAAELLRRGVPARFALAGTGPEEAALRAEARSLGLEAHLEFLGHVAEPRALYAQASVLLMTSRFEGTPLTILEAMAMQLPIVAPALDGIGEVLTHGREALLLTERAPAGFADAIARLLHDPALRATLTTAAEHKVRTHYSAEAMARAVEGIYEQCLARTRAARP